MPAFRAAAMARAIWSRCSYPLATWRALGAASAAAGDAPGSPQGTTLRVATFNLLADQYAEGGFHSHCPPKYLVWDYRRPRLLEQILALDADIMWVLLLQSAQALWPAGVPVTVTVPPSSLLLSACRQLGCRATRGDGEPQPPDGGQQLA